MTKTFNPTEPNSKAFYDFLHQQGVKDQEIDGTVVQDKQAKPADGEATAPSPAPLKDGKVSGQEVVAFVFNNFVKYSQQLQDHFKKLGLDISWLKPDGSINEAKKKACLAKLADGGPDSFAKLIPGKNIPEKGKDFLPSQSIFLAGDICAGLNRSPEFHLLSPTDQRMALHDYLLKRGLSEPQFNEVWSTVSKVLSANQQGSTPEKKIALAARIRGRELMAEGQSKEAQKILQASVEIQPNSVNARLEYATALAANGDSENARIHLEAAIAGLAGLSWKPDLNAIQSFLASPNGTALLKPGENSWQLIGDALLAGKKAKFAEYAYQRGSNAATETKDQALADSFKEKVELAKEAQDPYSLDFADPVSQEVGNPTAYGIFKALQAQGVPAGKINQVAAGQTDDRKLSATEVFDFLGKNLKDPRVQSVLKQLKMELSPEDEKAIAANGFGKFAADRYAAQADKLKQDPKVNPETVASYMLTAAYFEPENPARYEAMGKFYQEQKMIPLAMQVFSQALKINQDRPVPAVGDALAFNKSRDETATRLKKSIQSSFDNGMNEASEKYAAASKPDAKHPKGDLNLQFQALSSQADMLEAYFTAFPDKKNDPNLLRQLGSINQTQGQLLKSVGNTGEAKKFFDKAISHYQAGIDANPNDAAYCINVYKNMAAIHHEMGNYFLANEKLMIASQINRLRINYDPKTATKPPPALDSIKTDRGFTAATKTSEAKPVYVDPQTFGNFVHSDVHKIRSASGPDAIPAWADVGIGAYDRQMQDRLSERKTQQAGFESAKNPDLPKYLECLEDEARILDFLGKADEAKQVGETAAKVRGQVEYKRLQGEVAQLQSQGLLDAQDLLSAEKQLNEGQKTPIDFAKYLSFVAVKGKITVKYSPDFSQLSQDDKNRVMNALILCGQRKQIRNEIGLTTGAGKPLAEAKLLLFDGNRAAAKAKFEAFVKDNQGSKEPQILRLLAVTQSTLEKMNAADGKSHDQVLLDLRTLLAPLAMTLKPGKDGGIDLSSISKSKITSYEQFRDYLVGQVAVDGISFNDTSMNVNVLNHSLFGSYAKVLNDPKHDKLLRQLYAAFNPSATATPMSDTEMQKALRDFQKDLIFASPSRFVGNQLNTPEGRARLRTLLNDELFDKQVKARLCEEIVELGVDQGFTPTHIQMLFDKQVNSQGFWFQEDKLDLAMNYAGRVLTIGDQKDSARKNQVDKYEKFPQEVQYLTNKSLATPITPQSIASVARMIQDQGEKSDGVSQLKARLGTMWLSVIDNDNWKFEQQVDTHKGNVKDAYRAEMANQIQTFLKEAGDVKTDQDFLALSRKIRRFLRNQAVTPGENQNYERWIAASDKLAKIPGVGTLGQDGMKSVAHWVGETHELTTGIVMDTPEKSFEGMNPDITRGYKDLLKFTDEVYASDQQGMKIEAIDPDVAVTDPEEKQKTQKAIQELRGWKRSFWYQFQQRNLLSRSLSNTGGIVGAGDKAGIWAANKEIDSIIADLQKAKNKQDFEAIKERITAATKPGGAIHQGFTDAEMDGGEQVTNLVQTIIEIVGIELASGGMGSGVALGRATTALGRTALETRNLRAAFTAFREVRAAQMGLESVKALEMANMAKFGSAYKDMEAAGALVSTGEKGLAAATGVGRGARFAQSLGGEVGFAAKAARGFKLGAKISFAENLTGSLSGQLKAEPQSLLGWMKDALATGLSMWVSAGLSPVSAEQLQENLLKGLFQRYAANGAKGALHFLADTGLEVVEEVIDNYVRKKLDGNFSALSFDEIRDIVIVCTVGGVKQGLTSHLTSASGKIKGEVLLNGFKNGQSIVQDAHSKKFFLIDHEGAIVREAKVPERAFFLEYDAQAKGADSKGIVLQQFDSTKKGAKGTAFTLELAELPPLDVDQDAKTLVRKVEPAPAKSDPVAQALAEKQSQLYQEFFEQGYQVDWENAELHIGLLVIDPKENGKKIRQATLDEKKAYDSYQQLMAGFEKGSQRVVGSQQSGFTLVDADGNKVREATPLEQNLFQKYEARKHQPTQSQRLAATKGAATDPTIYEDTVIDVPPAASDRAGKSFGKLENSKGGGIEVAFLQSNPATVQIEGKARFNIVNQEGGGQVLKPEAGKVEVLRDGKWQAVGTEGVALQDGTQLRVDGDTYTWKPGLHLVITTGDIGTSTLPSTVSLEGLHEAESKEFYGLLTRDFSHVDADGKLRATVDRFLEDFRKDPQYFQKSEGIHNGSLVLVVHEGQIRIEATETVKNRIRAARDLAIRLGSESKRTFPDIALTVFLEWAARVPDLNAANPEAVFKRIMDGMDALKPGMKQLPRAEWAGAVESICRGLAVGTLEAKDIDNALGKGLNAHRSAELESQLGMPQSQWLQALAKDPAAFKQKLAVIEATRGHASDIVARIAAGEDRAQIKADILEKLKQQKVDLSTDNGKAVDSMIDLCLLARDAGLLNAKGGLSSEQLTGLMTTLYLHQSPSVRIGAAELTHVPMVVKGTLDFLLAANPNATVSQRRVAFVTALFHDAGKWDANLRTASGYTLKQHPAFNASGKEIVVRPEETLNEALQRLQDPKQTPPAQLLSAEDAAKVKIPGFLIGVIAHHDASNVKLAVTRDLVKQGILSDAEAKQAWQAIERHGLVSSWILNNSFEGIGVLSHVFNDPKYKQYIENFRELANLMQQGEKLDLSPETKDPIVRNVRRLFTELFSPLDQAMLLGDHQGQIDISKYMTILQNSPANKDATVHQLLLGGDSVNSVDGVLITHSDEQILIAPEPGQASAKAFNTADEWIRNLDPSKPGLAQALMKDDKTHAAYEKWKGENPGKPNGIADWLKAEKVKGADGQVTQTFKDIQGAIERGFYQDYALDEKRKSGYQWAPLPVEQRAEDVTQFAKLIEPPPVPLPRFPLDESLDIDAQGKIAQKPNLPPIDSRPLPRFRLPDEEGQGITPGPRYADQQGNLWSQPERAKAHDKLVEAKRKSKSPLTQEDYIQAYTDANGAPPSPADLKFFQRKFQGQFVDRFGQPHPTAVERDLVSVYGSVDQIPRFQDYAHGRATLVAMLSEPQTSLNSEALGNLVNILRFQFGKDANVQADLGTMGRLVEASHGNEARENDLFKKGSRVEARTFDGKTQYFRYTRWNYGGKFIEHPIKVDASVYFAYQRYLARNAPADVVGPLKPDVHRDRTWAKLVELHPDRSQAITETDWRNAWQANPENSPIGDQDLAYFRERYQGKFVTEAGQVSPIAPPPAVPRSGTPAGIVVGGFFAVGVSKIVPHDGRIVKLDPGLECRFNPESKQYQYRYTKDAADAWQDVPVGGRIQFEHKSYFVGELNGLPDDAKSGMDDGFKQFQYQMATAGTDWHLNQLRDAGKAVDGTDRSNLAAFFGENRDAAVHSHDGGNPIRSIGGLAGGTDQLFAFVDPQTGKILRFATRDVAPGEAQKDGLWVVTQNKSSGLYQWTDRTNPNRNQALDTSDLPLGVVIVPMTVIRMTGQVGVDLKAAKAAGLSADAMEKMRHVDNFMAQPGSPLVGAVARYQNGDGRNVAPPLLPTVAPQDADTNAGVRIKRMGKGKQGTGVYLLSPVQSDDVLSQFAGGAQWVQNLHQAFKFELKMRRENKPIPEELRAEVAASVKIMDALLEAQALNQEIRETEVKIAALPTDAAGEAERAKLNTELANVRGRFQSQVKMVEAWRAYDQGREKILKEISRTVGSYDVRATKFGAFHRGYSDEVPAGIPILDVSVKQPPFASDFENGSFQTKGDYEVIVDVRNARDQEALLVELQLKKDGNTKTIQRDGDGKIRSLEVKTPDGVTFTIRVDVLNSDQQSWVSDRDGIAAATNPGEYGKDHNEDSFVILNLPKGGTVSFVIDGMGGHEDGRTAAILVRRAFEDAIHDGKSVDEALHAADQAVLKYNQDKIDRLVAGGMDPKVANAKAGSAVGLTTEVSQQADQNYTVSFRGIGDCESLIVTFNDQGEPEIIDPEGLSHDEWIAKRLNPASNKVDQGFGGFYKSGRNGLEVRTREFHDLKAGSLVLSYSDGLESFTPTEIRQIIADSKAKTPAEVRNVLMRELLIRQKLYSLQAQGGKAPLELTHERYAQAYRDVTGQDAPEGWRGVLEGKWVDSRGVYGSQDTLRKSPRGQLYINPFEAEGRFKKDNATVVVQEIGVPIGSDPKDFKMKSAPPLSAQAQIFKDAQQKRVQDLVVQFGPLAIKSDNFKLLRAATATDQELLAKALGKMAFEDYQGIPVDGHPDAEANWVASREKDIRKVATQFGLENNPEFLQAAKQVYITDVLAQAPRIEATQPWQLKSVMLDSAPAVGNDNQTLTEGTAASAPRAKRPNRETDQATIRPGADQATVRPGKLAAKKDAEGTPQESGTRSIQPPPLGNDNAHFPPVNTDVHEGDTDPFNVVIPQHDAVPNQYTEKRAYIENDLIELVWPDKTGRPSFQQVAFLQELQYMPDGLKEWGREDLAKLVQSDVQAALDHPHDSPEYKAAIGRLGQILNLTRGKYNSDVMFMKPENFENFSAELNALYTSPTPTPAAGTPAAKPVKIPAEVLPQIQAQARSDGRFAPAAKRLLAGEIDFDRYQVEYLALSDTVFAPAAKDFMDGKINRDQYNQTQAAAADKIIAEHQEAYRDVLEFLKSIAKDPKLEGLGDPKGRIKEANSIAFKLVRRGWADMAPVTDVAATRMVVENNAQALAVFDQVVAKYDRYDADQAAVAQGKPAPKPSYRIREVYTSEGEIEVGEMSPDAMAKLGYAKEEHVLWLDAKLDHDAADRLINGHAASGYRALHIVVEIDGKPVEIQIKTAAMSEWGEIEHKLVYKNQDLPAEYLDPIKVYRKKVADYLAKITDAKPGESIGDPPAPPKLSADTPRLDQIENLIGQMDAVAKKYQAKESARLFVADHSGQLHPAATLKPTQVRQALQQWAAAHPETANQALHSGTVFTVRADGKVFPEANAAAVKARIAAVGVQVKSIAAKSGMQNDALQPILQEIIRQAATNPELDLAAAFEAERAKFSQYQVAAAKPGKPRGTRSESGE